jgi:uridine kinase
MRHIEALRFVERWLRDRGPSGVSVIAVDGHSAAGKSMFADAIAERTDATIVRGDDFYTVMADDDRARLSPQKGIESYYDWRRLRDEALLPLRRGSAATYHPYDWESGQLAAKRVTVPAAPVVVIEGLFVSRHELRPFADLSILIVAPPTIRWRRQVERADASEEWLRRWDAAERDFFAHVRPPSSFDVVVTS